MLSVLIVDDEKIIRKGLRKLIDWESLQCCITGEASNGKEALSIIQKIKVHILITDIKMPIMDGIELIAIINKDFPNIKVIVLSGYDDLTLIQKSIRNGIVDYLLKPVDEEMLKDALVRVKNKIQDEKYPYPFELESELLYQVSILNMDEVKQVLDRLYKEFDTYNIPFHFICKICQGILIKIDRILYQLGNQMKEITGEDVLCDSYFEALKTVENVKMKLYCLLDTIITYKKNNQSNKLIDKMKLYVRENCSKDITLEHLSNQFYLNGSYISQLFKNEGEKYSDYLAKERIEKAKKLINHTNLRLIDVCLMVGYSDQKNFGRIFKRFEGILPSEYKKKTAGR